MKLVTQSVQSGNSILALYCIVLLCYLHI